MDINPKSLIKSTFANFVHPGYENLVDKEIYYWEVDFFFNCGITNWEEFAIDDLIANSSCISFFSDMGFCFILPAYLNILPTNDDDVLDEWTPVFLRRLARMLRGNRLINLEQLSLVLEVVKYHIEYVLKDNIEGAICTYRNGTEESWGELLNAANEYKSNYST